MEFVKVFFPHWTGDKSNFGVFATRDIAFPWPVVVIEVGLPKAIVLKSNAMKLATDKHTFEWLRPVVEVDDIAEAKL